MFCLFRAHWRGLTEMSRGNLSLVRGITFPQPRQIIREGLIFGLRLRLRTGLLLLGTGRRRNRLTRRTEMGFSWRGNGDIYRCVKDSVLIAARLSLIVFLYDLACLSRASTIQSMPKVSWPQHSASAIRTLARSSTGTSRS